MSTQYPVWGKILRIVGIVLMGLTAAFTLLGGAGTTCVALDPTGFGGKFSGIAPFQWLYILFVVVTLAIGVMGVRAVVRLVRARRGSYMSAVAVMAAGILVGGIHMAASRALRGGSMPVDMVVYTTAFTMAIFLIMRLPGIWQGIQFERYEGSGQSGTTAAAITLAGAGLLTLSMQFLMRATHTVGGVNYADAWHAALTLLGGAFVMAGVLTAAYRGGGETQPSSVRPAPAAHRTQTDP